MLSFFSSYNEIFLVTTWLGLQILCPRTYGITKMDKKTKKPNQFTFFRLIYFLDHVDMFVSVSLTHYRGENPIPKLLPLMNTISIVSHV